MFSKMLLGALSLALLLTTTFAASPAEWRSRSIYQLLTDRFARTDGSTTATCDTASGIYCGGTWAGIIKKLDYIQGMGFDAVWISPVTKNIEGKTAYGEAYHGYWQQDLYAVNGHYGTSDDLKKLSSALHARGMYLMVDIVVNHNGWNGPPDSVDYTKFNPFNRKEDYNTPYCEIDYNRLGDTAQLTQCWVGGNLVPLPDLKTSSPRVREGYNTWIKSLTSNYSIDGLRLDTVLQVEKSFWKGFRDAVSDMYMIGEIFQEGADFVCDYQNYLTGLFNYPVYFPLINAFKSTSGDMAKLSESIDKNTVSCKDISLLGSFSENHDNARFPSQQGDIAQAANVITFTMIADGIPILYQGQEQHYDARGGANDPYNREALWFSGYNTDAQLYKLVASLNKARKNAIRNDPSFLTTAANPIYTDTTTIAVKKGKLMTVLSNKGSSGSNYTQPIRSYYQSGSSVTELLSCTKYTSDSGSYINVPMSAGMPRVFYPTADIGTLCGGATQDRVAGASYAEADTEVDAAAAAAPEESYSEETSASTPDSTADAAAASSDASTSASDSTSSSDSSADSTVLDSSMSRPARPNRPSRPNRATRNRARPSRAKLARRSNSGNMKASRWVA